MSHFAYVPKIENNVGLVEQVLVIEQDVIDTGLFGNPLDFYQTSFGTWGGVNSLGNASFRKNFAGIGYTFDMNRDAFIPPKDYPSWVLNEATCLWDAPIPKPADGVYVWDESNLVWQKVGD
jgi:hypothetical protein